MKRVLFLLPLIFVFLVTFSFAEDSDLVQAAKREKERREKLKQPAKVLTNQDLQKFKEKQGDRDSTETQSTATEDTAKAEDENAVEKDKDKEKGGANDEEYWRSRSADATAAVEEAKKKVDEIQNDVDTLWRAQTGVDDGQQKQLITSQRTDRLNELDKAKAELNAAIQAQQDLQEEARKAGAPPGWVNNQ